MSKYYKKVTHKELIAEIADNGALAETVGTNSWGDLLTDTGKV